jgi:glyoxylase-like metal-dependent hydrolase (beta-lactamase superfamily II)
MIEIYDITNSIFTSKTYILYKGGERKTWLVDIGDVEPVFSFLESKDLTVAGIFLSHAHFDHIYGLEALVERFPECKVYVEAYTKEALASAKLNMSKYHGTPIEYTGDNVVVVKEGETLQLFEGEPQMDFYETPGHNPGCLTMVMGDIIFTGDAYIPGVGANTKPPRADKELAKKSLERILKLAEGKKILSGHETDQDRKELL